MQNKLSIRFFDGREKRVLGTEQRAADHSLDGRSRAQAYTLFECGLLERTAPGTVESLRQIHAYLFGGLYDFAGRLRTVDIAKGNFHFAPAFFLESTLARIEQMPQNTFDEITDK